MGVKKPKYILPFHERGNNKMTDTEKLLKITTEQNSLIISLLANILVNITEGGGVATRALIRAEEIEEEAESIGEKL